MQLIKISIQAIVILIFFFSCDSADENNDSESLEYNLTGLWVKDSVKAEYGEECTEIGFHPGSSLFRGWDYIGFSGCYPPHNSECYNNNYSDSTIIETCSSILNQMNPFYYSQLDSCSVSKMLITNNNIIKYYQYIDSTYYGDIAHIDQIWWSSDNIFVSPMSLINNPSTMDFLSPDSLKIVFEYDPNAFGAVEVDAPSVEIYLRIDLLDNYLEISRSFIHNECDIKYTHSYLRDFTPVSYDIMVVPDYLAVEDFFSSDIDWGIPAGCGLLTTLDVFEGNPININSVLALPDVVSWTQIYPYDFDLWVEESTPISFSIYNSSPVQDGCDLPENHLYLSGNNILYNSNIDIEQFRFNVTGAIITGGVGGDIENSDYTVFGTPSVW